ncbi:UNVERIFIED_CONTAM: hypothetical protein PYX00_004999 [Menopon gallinae]|uniref:Uncharacterized protein n=1 Tax=Menopon gallinae TaxID=328185 RepID=A0AAW2I7N8_9NEOP
MTASPSEEFDFGKRSEGSFCSNHSCVSNCNCFLRNASPIVVSPSPIRPVFYASYPGSSSSGGGGDLPTVVRYRSPEFGQSAVVNVHHHHHSHQGHHHHHQQQFLFEDAEALEVLSPPSNHPEKIVTISSSNTEDDFEMTPDLADEITGISSGSDGGE